MKSIREIPPALLLQTGMFTVLKAITFIVDN